MKVLNTKNIPKSDKFQSPYGGRTNFMPNSPTQGKKVAHGLTLIMLVYFVIICFNGISGDI